MSPEASLKFKFYILGLKNGFRGYPLLDELRGLNYDVEIVWGIDGRDSKPYISTVDERISKFYNNRILTNPERATTLGHWKMFDNALEGDAEFLVFLEDDAKLCDVNLLSQSLLEIKQSFEKNTSNCLWLLIQRNFNELGFRGQKRKGMIFSDTLTIPTLSSAYVINREGLSDLCKAISSCENRGYAPDFPPFYADSLRFKVPSTSIFDVTGEESVIGNERWMMQRFERFHLAKQIARFTAVSWFIEGRNYSTLKSFLLYFHGRKAVHLKLKLFECQRSIIK